MNPGDLYRQKLISIPEAVGKLQSHQTLGLAMAASEPPGLMNELGNHRDRLEDVHVWVCLPLGSYSFVLDPVMEGRFFVENWFYGAADRKVHDQGRESYIPNNLHQAATRKLYAAGNRVNVYFGTATPPDERGYMSLSLGLVLEKQLIEQADQVSLVDEQQRALDAPAHERRRFGDGPAGNRHMQPRRVILDQLLHPARNVGNIAYQVVIIQYQHHIILKVERELVDERCQDGGRSSHTAALQALKQWV